MPKTTQTRLTTRVPGFTNADGAGDGDGHGVFAAGQSAHPVAEHPDLAPPLEFGSGQLVGIAAVGVAYARGRHHGESGHACHPA